MNFFKHHIGDYAAATAHLSWDEDMAYTRLMRAYYQHERAIPADKRAAYRLVRAQSAAQRKAVDVVLEEFFTPGDDGWHQKRCDEEIGKANEQADTNRRIATDREAKRQTRSVQRPVARIGNEPSHESFTLKAVEREPSQTPDSTSQTPDKSKSFESTNVDLSPEPMKLDSDDDLPGIQKCPVQRIVATYHRVLPELSPVNELPEQTVKMIRARWRSLPERQHLAWWDEYFQYVRGCPFLMGEKTDFKADLLWLVRPTNFAKVINGNYEERVA